MRQEFPIQSNPQKLNLPLIIGALLIPVGAVLGAIGLAVSGQFWLRTTLYFAGFLCCVVSVFLTLKGARSALPTSSIGSVSNEEPEPDGNSSDGGGDKAGKNPNP